MSTTADTLRAESRRREAEASAERRRRVIAMHREDAAAAQAAGDLDHAADLLELAAELEAQDGAPPPNAPPHPHAAPGTPNMATMCDEILAARREHRPPAAWATSGPHAPDMGDLIVRSLGWDRMPEDRDATVDGQRATNTQHTPAATAPPTHTGPAPRPANPDMGDKVAELWLAQREGREPASWALEPGA